MKLFISYRSLDSAKVDPIVAHLRSLHTNSLPTHHVWLDKDSISPGDDWWKAIVRSIGESEVLLFMVSRESAQNVNCRAELSYARRRNRPIVPVVLEGEYIYNPKTGKKDIDFWPLIPDELNEMRAQFLFYEGGTFIDQLAQALVTIRQEPKRWRDIPIGEAPPDPRPTEGENINTAAIWDEACDYAWRGEIKTARKLFQRLITNADPTFGDFAYEWILILNEYDQLLSFDTRSSTYFQIKARWPNYAGFFPKAFVEFYDPRNIYSRHIAVGTRPAASAAVAPPPPPKVEPPKPTQPAISSDQQRLLAIMLDIKRPPQERAAAGDNLAKIGDPRPGVLDLDFGADYWCKVPAGKFIMGSDQDSDNKKREESITADYWIGKYPITYAQYKAFLDDPHGFRDGQWWQGLHANGLAQQKQGAGSQDWPIANRPAENVSWYEAMAFCRWLSAKLGYAITLPTEQQWEKAARGTDGREYPYSGNFDANKGNTRETGIGQTSAVGIFPDGMSPYGVFDMSGNVWEWTLTEYESKSGNITDNNNSRSVRGGSWGFDRGLARAAYRGYGGPVFRDGGFGFRVGRSVPVN